MILWKIRCKSKLSKFIKKAQQVKKQNKNKTITVVGFNATKETEVESVSQSPNVPEIDKHKQAVNISFEQLCKDKKEGTVLLIGDSLARGVGCHLKSQHSMFESHAFGGASVTLFCPSPGQDSAAGCIWIAQGPRSMR